MKIIEGKQAVVNQIETKTAVQNHAAQAVYRDVLAPEYQTLHYHGEKRSQRSRYRDAGVCGRNTRTVGS